MASQKTLSDIAALDVKINRLEDSLAQMEIIDEQEEGSQGSRFRTKFQSLDKTEKRLEKLKASRARLMMVV